MQGKTKQQAFDAGKENQIRMMIFVAVWILVIAIVISLLAPSGTPLQKCTHAWLSQNKEQCLYSLALSSKNGTLCANLSSTDSASCYFAVAEARGNVSMCGKVNDSNASAQCTVFVANATNNFGDCYDLKSTGRSYCLDTLALKDYNASLCSGLSNSTNRSICSSSIRFSDALRLDNATYCSQVTPNPNPVITSSVLYNSGALDYGRIAGNLSGYSTFMGFSQQNVQFTARDFCYFAYATQFHNESSCSLISNATLSNACTYAAVPQVAQNSSNSTGTFNYTRLLDACAAEPGVNQTACVAVVKTVDAENTRNASVCGTLAGNYSYECYTSMAENFLNATFCGYIKNYSIYNACVQDTYYNATAASNGTAAYP